MSGLTDSQAVLLLTQYFGTNFTGAKVVYQDEPISTDWTGPYVRMSVLLGDPQPNLDSTWERVTGIAWFQTFTVQGVGDVAAWSLADAVANVMKYQTIGIIRLTSAGKQNLGAGKTTWNRIDVRVPFFFERVTS
jgi:hypothetical protein